MSEREKQSPSKADEPEVQVEASEAPKEPSQGEIDAVEPQEPEVKITLDRYLSKRRPPPRSRWSLIASLILMLAALVMVFAFKNRCGLIAVDLLGGGGTGTGSAAAPAKK